MLTVYFFFSSRRRHTRLQGDWSSDVCSSDLDFIAGSRPVTEDQVRQKLVSDGWSDVQIVVRGRYFIATASKDGRSDAFAVDSLTGRLRGEETDDDDWPE